MKAITVTVTPTGEVKIEGHGFKGGACDKAMAELERTLGDETKRIKKPDYFQGQQQGQQQGH